MDLPYFINNASFSKIINLEDLNLESFKIEIYDNSMSEWAMDHQLPIEKDNILK